jgi:ElaB/YqjD/DUF883 family membrane-anchored ribosome-binding protein
MMSARGNPAVSDEALSERNAHELQADMEKSRESAARLLDSLAYKVGGSRIVRSAASGVERAAHYVQAHSGKDIAVGIERALRSYPASAVAIAVVAGFLVGRALRSRQVEKQQFIWRRIHM